MTCGRDAVVRVPSLCSEAGAECGPPVQALARCGVEEAGAVLSLRAYPGVSPPLPPLSGFLTPPAPTQRELPLRLV